MHPNHGPIVEECIRRSVVLFLPRNLTVLHWNIAPAHYCAPRYTYISLQTKKSPGAIPGLVVTGLPGLAGSVPPTPPLHRESVSIF